MGFLGEALRRMPVSDRPRWPDVLPELEFAFNTAISSSTSFSPFEIQHGMPARTVVSVLPLEPADVSACEAKSSGLYGNIREAAKLYSEIATKCRIEAKRDYIGRLNKSGVKREYAPGDKVSIFLPSRGMDDAWKPKHCLDWVGPMTVVKRIASTMYEVKEKGGRVFERSVANISPYKPTDSAGCSDSSSSSDDSDGGVPEFKVGQMLAVKDEKNPALFWIVEVYCLAEDDEAHCHFWATTNPSIQRAKFKRVWVERGTGLSIWRTAPRPM